jgi:hypothetical protein
MMNRKQIWHFGAGRGIRAGAYYIQILVNTNHLGDDLSIPKPYLDGRDEGWKSLVLHILISIVWYLIFEWNNSEHMGEATISHISTPSVHLITLPGSEPFRKYREEWCNSNFSFSFFHYFYGIRNRWLKKHMTVLIASSCWIFPLTYRPIAISMSRTNNFPLSFNQSANLGEFEFQF